MSYAQRLKVEKMLKDGWLIVKNQDRIKGDPVLLERDGKFAKIDIDGTEK